jgi:ParB family chromosome partitioning protein
MFANIPIGDIIVTGKNNREVFDEAEIENLAETIKKYGILENLILRPSAEQPGKYDLIAGERRIRAAKLIGLPVVPCTIKDANDSEFNEIMIIENLLRQDLNAIEEAKGLKRLLDQGKTQEEIALSIGKSQPWIANRLRLLDAPEEVRNLIISREITPKHGLALLPFKQYPVLKDILEGLKEELGNGSVSVKALEKIIEDQISGYGGSDKVFCLDEFEYNVRYLQPFWNFDDCNKPCSHIVKCKRYGSDRRYCLNYTCWQAKLKDAKNRFEIKKAAKIKSLAKKDRVNTSKMDWDDYKRLDLNPGTYSDTKFDAVECEGCEYRALNQDEDEVCLNPECYNKKNRQAQKAAAQDEQEEAKRYWETVDVYLDNLPENSLYANEGGSRARRYPSMNQDVLRTILNVFGRSTWGEVGKKAFKRWADGSVPGRNSDEFGELLARIPDDELDQALIRLACAVVAVQGDSSFARGAKIETLEKIFPEAAKHFSKEVA